MQSFLTEIVTLKKTLRPNEIPSIQRRKVQMRSERIWLNNQRRIKLIYCIILDRFSKEQLLSLYHFPMYNFSRNRTTTLSTTLWIAWYKLKIRLTHIRAELQADALKSTLRPKHNEIQQNLVKWTQVRG